MLLLIVQHLAISNLFAAETPESLRDKSSAVLARIEGEITLPGLREQVEVLRDRWGVPHIYANSADDLFFAQGFVVAQDRLFQIDMWRRVGLGETAEVLGKEGIAGDRFARLMKYRGDWNAEWNSYSPDAKRIATQFTRGINACIDHFGKNLPIEFQLLDYQPARWQPEDILGRMSGLIMSSNFRSEVARTELIRAVGLEKARRISPTDPVREFAPMPGLDLGAIDRSLIKDYELATRSLPYEAAHSGSNNWAVDGTLSASGKPLLAGDPHRSILLPSLRYIVHLNAPGWNVIGSGEPALPGVAIGHNDRVAWAFTIVGTDQADFYIEETKPDDSTQYKAGDHWEPMKIVHEKLKVRGASEPLEIELRFTRHGPVIREDEKRHQAVALRWVGHEPGTAAYLPSLRLDRVKDAGEFVEQLAHWKIPALNMVHADVSGRIGWVAAGLTPVRQGWDGLLPVSGDGQHEWQRFLTVAELPQVHNPANHWVATANHNILPPGYHREISYEWSPPYRFGRIKQRLEAKQKFDLDEFQNMQHDNTSLPAQSLVRLLGEVDLKDVDSECASSMRSWDGVLSRDSRPAVLYAFWLKELLRGFFKAHVPAETLEFLQDSRAVTIMLAALEHPDESWFGDDPRKGRDKLLASTLAAAVVQARDRFAKFPAEGTWGEMHTATFEHPLGRLGPAHAQAFNLGPVPRGGDGVTPHATSYNKRFQQVSGATYRHVLDLADWDRGLATSSPGQSGQLGSPHYGDLLPLWNEAKYFPLAFSRAKVKEVTQHRLVLRPVQR